MDKGELWKATLAELELDTSSANFTMWLKPTLLLSRERVDNKRYIATIACRSPYQRTMVENRYYAQIKRSLDRLTDHFNELVFVIKSDSPSQTPPPGPLFEPPTPPSSHSAYEEAVGRVRLRPDYTFETFAVSSTNEMAHAAASAVAHNPGRAYHLLYLYGGVGVGKTHLMNAIGHEILRVDPSTETLLRSGEEFMNELVQAIQSKQTTAFKSRYRRVKVFLVDDIQFIAGKDAVQEEFFHTFNAIVQNQGQIVLTSDKLPEEMVLLEDRLRSRFEGGLTIDIQEPNFELRVAILQIKAKARGVTLPTDVTQLVASQIKSTRGLEGFLARLIAQAGATHEPITPTLVDTILGTKPAGFEGRRRYVPPQDIIDLVAKHFALKPAAVRGKRRTKDLVQARHLAMYLLRRDLEIPLKEVGRFFGGKDHTTVMHAVEKINDELDQSEPLRENLSLLRGALWGNEGKIEA